MIFVFFVGAHFVFISELEIQKMGQNEQNQS